MMGLSHTLFTPSSHGASSVTPDDKTQPPRTPPSPPHPTKPPNNVRRCYIRKRDLATISCGTTVVIKVWLPVGTLLFFFLGGLSIFLESSHHSCTAGLLLRTFCDTQTHTHPLASFLSVHTPSHSLSRALVLTCSETGSFLKVPARPGAVDAVSRVKLELETDAELCS